MEKPSKEMLGAIALVLIVVTVPYVWVSAADTCTIATGELAAEIRKANGCLDYWANRYQTTMQTIASIVLGAIGLYFVVTQISQIIKQNKLISDQLAAQKIQLDASYRVACGRAKVAIDQYEAAALIIMMEIIRVRQPDLRGEAGDLDGPALLARQGTPAVYEAMRDATMASEWKVIAHEFEDLRLYAIVRREGFSPLEIAQLNNDRRLPENDEQAERRAIALPESLRAFAARIDI